MGEISKVKAVEFGGKPMIYLGVHGLDGAGGVGMTAGGNLPDIIHFGSLYLTVEQAQQLCEDLGRSLDQIGRGEIEREISS